MYCPKCGEVLQGSPEGLYCATGDMHLSQYMEQRFIKCFILKTSKPDSRPFKVKVGGTWFCPGCGIRMNEDGGYVRCSKCQLSFNEFIHELIELHPHKR